LTASRSWTGPRISWRHRPTGRVGRRIAGELLAEREEALRRAPLFAGLPARQLRRLARASGITDRREGTTVVKEGATGSVFYVILDGKAKVIRRGRTVARLKAGDFFGEMALLDGEPRTASVVTETDARFLTLSRKDFREALDADATLSKRIMQEMAGRIRELEQPPAG
jgi:CRP/FNR family cyclic AMP-dependent transcriptional regulator